MNQTAIVIPNLNGVDSLGKCLDSLLPQCNKIIVVENGSVDNSKDFIRTRYPQVDLIVNKTNLGFAGGVNCGIKKAIKEGFLYVALFNNDAVAEKNWLGSLIKELDNNPRVGIATCKLLSSDKKSIDSTGDQYTNWGLPYPRGRGEPTSNKYDKDTTIFAASGGASIYRISMLTEIGLFDEDFFAYYEDVDISFRAQLAGWKVHYVPKALAYHQIGATSSKIKGFTTYQTMKNLPLLWYKNVPNKYFFSVGLRLLFAQSLFLIKAITRKNGRHALKGSLFAGILIIKKRGLRRDIQTNKKVSDEYIWQQITHNLPPNSKSLRYIVEKWSKIKRNYGKNNN
jgi:hypothetical protein